jgi:hypothetical protein
VLGKQDQALVLSRQELEFVMHLSDLERVRDGLFRVFELTAIPPGMSRPDGEPIRNKVEELLEQLIDFKCVALGLNPPNRNQQAQNNGLFRTQDIVQAANSVA